MYFGNDTAGSPPADPENVWLLYEDFESGTLGDFEDRTAGSGWYQADPWTNRIPLSVQASQVDEALTDFVVSVQVTDAALGVGAAADGGDIRFTAADGVTPLDHEIESWDDSTGALTAWVRLPSISSSSDTDFHLLYGAADAPSQETPGDVWSNRFGIWHLDRDPGGPAPHIDDVTRSRADGLSTGAMTTTDLVAGRIGSAVDFDGADDRLEIEPFDVTGKTITVSGWLRLASVSGDQTVVAKANSATDRILTLGTTGAAARFELRLDGTTHTVTGGTLGSGAWHHLAATWNGATMTLYIDGIAVGTTSASGTIDRDLTMPVTIGGLTGGQRQLGGQVDEVRLEAVVRSAGWLLASVRNQSYPSAFLATGTGQSGSWFAQGTWSYRKPLAVDPALVTSDLTDQPVLIEFTDPELVGKLQADGDDVVFTAADGTTRLDHELEAVDAAGGAVTAWVRVPLVSSSAAAELFMYYGNSSATDQQDPEAVWGAEADLIFHGS